MRGELAASSQLNGFEGMGRLSLDDIQLLNLARSDTFSGEPSVGADAAPEPTVSLTVAAPSSLAYRWGSTLLVAGVVGLCGAPFLPSLATLFVLRCLDTAYERIAKAGVKS